MKTTLLLLSILTGNILLAQTFTEVMDAPFENVHFGSIASADIDNDGDEDLLITGATSYTECTSKLYINNQGVYSEVMETPFEQVSQSSIAFADVDGDNDLDVLITGKTSDNNRVAKLYTNDAGIFTEVMETPFEGVSNGEVAFADIDGDNDLDLLISGEVYTDTNFEEITKLYINNGGVFSEVLDTPFQSVSSSSIAFADIDGDSDLDLFISGFTFYNEYPESSFLYINNEGQYSLDEENEIVPTYGGSAVFSDFDGDSDPDLLITGVYSSYETGELEYSCLAKMYTNDGGLFDEDSFTPIMGVADSAVKLADINNDGHLDVLITGYYDMSFQPITKLYMYESGDFVETTASPFVNLYGGTINFMDIDNDGDQDVIISGLNSSIQSTTKLYLNDLITSVDEKNFQLDFALYPNPSAEDYITINYPSKTNGQITANIFDLQGRLISQQKQRALANQTFTIDTSALSQGTYVLQLVDGERMGSREFVVK